MANVDNQAKEFYDKYGEEFYNFILETPKVAMIKAQHNLIPYEYADKEDKKVRFKRYPSYSDQNLLKYKKLVLYCIEKKINKLFLNEITSGNLELYYKMKKSYIDIKN